MAGRMDMIALIDVPGVSPLWDIRSQRLVNSLHDSVFLLNQCKKERKAPWPQRSSITPADNRMMGRNESVPWMKCEANTFDRGQESRERSKQHPVRIHTME
jgi:hypothetical protein